MPRIPKNPTWPFVGFWRNHFWEIFKTHAFGWPLMQICTNFPNRKSYYFGADQKVSLQIPPPLVRFFLEKKGGIWSKIFLLGISLLKNFPALRAGGKEGGGGIWSDTFWWDQMNFGYFFATLIQNLFKDFVKMQLQKICRSIIIITAAEKHFENKSIFF